MPDYVKTDISGDWIAVWFYNENDKPFVIGEKMCAINENAYMNGYNWDALFNYYLGVHAPELLTISRARKTRKRLGALHRSSYL